MLKDFHIDEDSGDTAKIIEVNEDENGNRASSDKSREKYLFGKHVVGCDGPSSVVANQLQIKFDGLLNLANTKSSQ